MHKKSAGLLVYRQTDGQLQVFLVHPGGPFWEKKDEGAWSIPKGLFSDDEDPLEAARREFEEETGVVITGHYEPLEPVKQPSGKTVYAWVVRGDFDAASIKSNLFSMEWPRGSGVTREFPEVDRAAWFPTDVARRKILKGQVPFLPVVSLLQVTNRTTLDDSLANVRSLKSRRPNQRLERTGGQPAYFLRAAVAAGRSATGRYCDTMQEVVAE